MAFGYSAASNASALSAKPSFMAFLLTISIFKLLGLFFSI
jgi:hypothetical protein